MIMVYQLEIPDHLDKAFSKLAKKNKKQLEIIRRKVEEILEDPCCYKPLRGDMHGAFRVHIDKSFVLTFEVDEQKRTVRLLEYGHHDDIYQ